MGTQLPLHKKGAKPQSSVHVCGVQIAAWIKMPLGMEVCLGPSDFALDGNPAPLPKTGAARPIFAHVYCGQTAAWINMALGVEMGLNPGYTVLYSGPAPLPKKGAEPPNSRPISVVAKRLDASRCH